jgi:transcription initiation factor TFIID TATA-box-binding protein
VSGVKTVVQRLKAGGIEILSGPIVEIQNVVTTIDLGGKILLKEVAQQLPRSIYEPDQFPGLILRVNDPKVVFLIFTSGKLVCTSAKKEVEVYWAANNLHDTLEEKGLITY